MGCALSAVMPSVALFTFLLPLDDKEILVYSENVFAGYSGFTGSENWAAPAPSNFSKRITLKFLFLRNMMLLVLQKMFAKSYLQVSIKYVII